MSHHHHHHRRPSTPSEPFLNFRTTSEILRQTASIFWSHLLTFLFLAFLILIFRSNVDNGTHLLTRFIDRDPSLKALFNRLHITGDNHYSQSQFGGAAPRRPRRRLLHLTRVGTIDDDFFSGDDDTDRPLFGSNPKTPSNSSFLIYTSTDEFLLCFIAGINGCQGTGNKSLYMPHTKYHPNLAVNHWEAHFYSSKWIIQGNSSILWGSSAPYNMEKDVLIAGDTQFGSRCETVFLPSLIQQCLEEWVLE